MFGASKLIALILAFTLGFSCAGGIIVGGVAIALGSFRVRDIEKYEIMDIPDELFMEENPKTDLLNLTAFEMIEEMKRLYQLGDGVSINYLQNEYGLKLPSAAQKFLTDEAREMPIKAMFSEAGVKSLLSTIYIGYVQSFECHALDSCEPADPALGKDGARWYNPTTGKYVTGINETLAFISLGDFVSGKVDVTAVIGGLHIGDAVGYYCETDPETGDEIWYDGVTGKPATGLLGAFAGSTIYSISEDINGIKLGNIFGLYQLEKDGPWYEDDKDGNPVLANGLTASLADSTMDSIDEDMMNISLGNLLGYYQLEKDGPWYEDDKDGNPVLAKGLMASLADSTMDTIDDDIQTIQLGHIFGLYQLEEDGPWYEDDKDGNPVLAKGLTASLADSTIKTIDKDIPTIQIGVLLGYEEIDGEWKKYNEETEEYESATGVMAILVDCDMDGVGDAINEAKLGELLGYENKNGVWYENDQPVSGFMGKIADSSLVADENGEGGVGNVLNSLTISDMISEEDQDKGIFAILPSDTKITEIAGTINNSISESPLQFFINEGLISFDDVTQNSLDTLCVKTKSFSEDDEDFKKYYKDHGDWVKVGNYYLIPEWRTQPLSSSFNYIINMLIPPVPIDE